MKQNKRMVAGILEILVGAVTLICNFAGLVDEYWVGMGAALIVVGAIQLVRHIRYKTNESYRENMDMEANDERNRFIATKAWSWAGYFFVMVAAVASIVLKIAGLDEYVMMASGSICLILVLYWLSYLYLRKKY